MINILATCPDCGDVRVYGENVQVRVCAEDRSGTFCFTCPRCGLACAKSCEEDIVQLLIDGGVRCEVWHLPAELGEPHSGNPISYGNVLDFHETLQSLFNPLEELTDT